MRCGNSLVLLNKNGSGEYDWIFCSWMFPYFITSVPVTGACDSIAAMSGILKRKFEEVNGTSPCSCVWDSDDDISSSESADSRSNVHPSASNHFIRKY